MMFEMLANELFLELFQYFKLSHLFHAFYSLNSRFNKLIFIYLKNNSSLNFHSISKQNFNSICQYYLPSMMNDILSLTFSNDDETPQQIELFFSYNFHFYQFINLQSISFYQIYSPTLIQNIIIDLTNLPNLIRLSCIDCYLSLLYEHLWKLSKLIYLQLHDISNEKISINLIKPISSSIEYLSIKNSSMTMKDIYHLLKDKPCLQHVQLYINLDNEEINVSEDFPSIIKFELYDERSYPPKLHLINHIPEIICLLRAMPNLIHLTIETPFIFLDGYRWKCLIKSFFPKLRIFHLKMSFYFNNFNTIKTRIDYIFNSFQNQFWMNEHPWFIRCHWNSEDKYSQYILFYTYPYTFSYLSIPNNYRWFRSTYPYDDNPWLSSHVHHLLYNPLLIEHYSRPRPQTSSLKSNKIFQFNSKKTRSFSLSNTQSTIIPSSFEKTIQITSITSSSLDISPILHFSNIYQLTLEFPIDEYFWWIIPKLNRLITLNVKNIDQSQLQILFDRAPNLYSININLHLTKLIYFLINNTSKSIRRINFNKNLFFNHEQCIALTRSSLGKQCEILSIGIRNRRDIFNLINKMFNLRTLNIRCKDDDDNDFIHYLQEHLSSTILIKRDIKYDHNIRLWIR